MKQGIVDKVLECLGQKDWITADGQWFRFFRKREFKAGFHDAARVADAPFFNKVVKVSWIDAATWEENTRQGMLTISFSKDEVFEPWKITGLTIAAFPSSISKALAEGRVQSFT